MSGQSPFIRPIGETSRSPVELLADVAERQIGSRRGSVPTLPLSASVLLSEWAAGHMGTLEDARERLIEAARMPERVTRLKRALPILAAGLPVLLFIAATTLAIRVVRAFATPDNIQIVGLLTALPEQSPEVREAVEMYLAGRYRTQLADDDFWSGLAMQGNLARLRVPARALLDAHPVVTDEDLARIAGIVKPEVSRAEALYTDSIAPRLAQSGFIILCVLAAIFLAFATFNALLSATAVRGGVVSRLIGLAAITRDGREVTRGRSLLRAVVAWSPVIVWLASLGTSPVDRVMAGETPTVIGLAMAILVMAAGAAWSIARPHQGPHDWICRTWVVPR